MSPAKDARDPIEVASAAELCPIPRPARPAVPSPGGAAQGRVDFADTLPSLLTCNAGHDFIAV